MLPQQPRKVSSFPQTSTNATTDIANKTRKQSMPPPTSERIDRTSFSSIKESISGGVQSFTDSKTSSYLRHEYSLVNDEDAVDDLDPGSKTLLQQNLGDTVGMLNPHSTLHGLVCPCDGFKGWKSISVRGKLASKSFGDLTKLRMRWDATLREEANLDLDPMQTKALQQDGRYPAGRSAFEMLPMELLGKLMILLGLRRSHSSNWFFSNLLLDSRQHGDLDATRWRKLSSQSCNLYSSLLPRKLVQ